MNRHEVWQAIESEALVTMDVERCHELRDKLCFPHIDFSGCDGVQLIITKPEFEIGSCRVTGGTVKAHDGTIYGSAEFLTPIKALSLVPVASRPVEDDDPAEQLALF